MRQASRHRGTKVRRVNAAVRCAFTLTELMVAVLVLIVVIIATSKIFGTASRITGVGQGTAAVIQEAIAIERQIRDDIAKLSTEGFFAIRCVAVRNDIHQATNPGAALLNPNLPDDALVRCDQLVFFANGVESIHTARVTQNSYKGQGVISRVYYGHAFQLPKASPSLKVDDNLVNAHDPQTTANDATIVRPWHRGNTVMKSTRFTTTSQGTVYFPGTPIAGPAGLFDATQPEARRWLLVRQPIALVDDDNSNANSDSKTVFLQQHPTARSIFLANPANSASFAKWGWSEEVRNGRVDAAASEVNDIRSWVTVSNASTGALRPWSGSPATPDQRTLISRDAVFYPRAERAAPSGNRVDQALTNHVIGSACSSFIVDWSYDDGVGFAVNQNGLVFRGVTIDPGMERPWFGLVDPLRGVMRYSDWASMGPAPGYGAETILPINGAFPNNIESATASPPLPAGVTDYWAIFGYNQTRPFDAAGAPDVNLGYTPFPSALRITMTLHDPEGRLEGGREFQFVVRLPRPVN